MTEYTLTLNSDQAYEVLKTLELLMRWKLKQPDLVTYLLLDMSEDVNTYCRKRDTISPKLKEAMDIMVPPSEEFIPGKLKDDEWYRIYNIFQVLRKAIHDAEHPNSTGVDAYPPMKFTSEPLPSCIWKTETNVGKV